MSKGPHSPRATAGSRRSSLALPDNYESSSRTPTAGSRRSSLALPDNYESPSRTPTAGSRRSSLALPDNYESPSRTPTPGDNFEASGSAAGSRKASLALSENVHRDNLSQNECRERQLMNLAIAAHEGQKAKKKEAQVDAMLTAAQKLKSNLLRVLLTSAVTGTMSNWSKAAKKAFLLSQVDPKLTRAFIERTQLKVMFMLAIMNVACICLQCTSSRVLESYRDAEVDRQQVENLVSCCKGFNLTLINGKCGVADSEARKTCVVDASLIVSTDTDFAVSYGTDPFWMSFYLNSAVSALSVFSVIALFYHAHLSKKLILFSKQLETNSVGHFSDINWSKVLTPTFWFQIFLVLVHMPPLPFDVPVLEFEHPYYTESKLLKYPWISLVSAFVTLRVYFVLIYIRDRTIIEWSSKRRIVERKTGVNVDAVFVLKVLMSEAPMTVVCGAAVGVFGILTYWMLVVERNSEWLRTFQDSLWLIVITAFTVGYGDIYPKTFLGRAISIAAGVLGVIFAALGTAALSNKLSWTTAEWNVSKLLMKSVLEKKLAHSAVVYLQRTFRRITNRGPSHFCVSRDSAQRKDRNDWIDAKLEFSAFKQNQDNMELLLKGILDDSSKIGKVTQFLNDHEGTKDWISSVTKGSNHSLQLVTSVHVLEEQLKKLQSVTSAALEKQTNHSTSDKGQSSIASIEQKHQIERFVDPKDGSVDSLIQELNGLCDILDENNKDLEWFAKEINSRVRGKAGEEGPDWQLSSSASFSKQDYPSQEHPPHAFSNSSFSQFQPIQPMNSSPGQSQYQSMPDYINAMQQQAAAQMQMQTELMTKLFAALESPKGNRSRSRGHDRSRSRSSRKERGRSASAHSRSRSRHADATSVYDEDQEDQDHFAKAATPRRRKQNPRSAAVLDQGDFSADGEVWLDEDENSAVTSLASSPPNSRPISASSSIPVNSSEQATPRMASSLHGRARSQRP